MKRRGNIGVPVWKSHFCEHRELVQKSFVKPSGEGKGKVFYYIACEKCGESGLAHANPQVAKTLFYRGFS